MLQDFPRFTLLYYRTFDYDAVFLPLMQTVIDKPQHCEKVKNVEEFYDASDSTNCVKVSSWLCLTVWPSILVCCVSLSYERQGSVKDQRLVEKKRPVK